MSDSVLPRMRVQRPVGYDISSRDVEDGEAVDFSFPLRRRILASPVMPPLEKQGVVNMMDVAKALGLSRVTVSAVLNNRHRKAGISDETAVKVKEAARELGYFRNDLAMAMKSGHNLVIGAMVSNLATAWVGRILSGILQGTRESEYLIKLEEVSGAQAEEAALSRFIGQRVAGILCCNFHPEEDFVADFTRTTSRYSVPVVSVSSSLSLPGSRIMSDDYTGSAQAVKHLWELGHRNICYVNGMGKYAWIRDRTQGFLDTLEQLGCKLRADTIVQSPFDANEMEATVRHLLGKKRNRPTAVVCINDIAGAICLRVARSLGLDVPGDLSVVCYEGGVAAYTDPPLTVVRQPFTEMGLRCVKELLAMIEMSRDAARRRKKPENIVLPLTFQPGSSTAACPPRRATRR